jgi:hypothetical protein
VSHCFYVWNIKTNAGAWWIAPDAETAKREYAAWKRLESTADLAARLKEPRVDHEGLRII